MKDLIISVIVPVYDVELYLEECIVSIINQSYRWLEILLIDDGSTDKSSSICDAFAKHDSRIMVVHKENGGVSSARNVGLSLARGELISFVDSDDLLDINHYSYMVERMLSDESDMCVLNLFLIDKRIYSHSKLENEVIRKDEAIIELLKMNFPTSLWACIYKFEVLRNLTLNEKIHYWEDYEFQFRALLKIERISILNCATYHYRQREGSANYQEFNIKILTSLEVPRIVHNIVLKQYPKLETVSKNLYPVFVLNTIGYLSKSKKVKNEFYQRITRESRNVIFNVLFNREISIISKIYIILCSLDSRFFHLLHRAIKKIKSI